MRPRTGEIEKAETNISLSQKVIKPAQTVKAALIAFAPRKDGFVRFRVDYQKLSAVTKWNFLSIPRIDDCIACFWKAAVFFLLDAISGYWQFEVEKTGPIKPYSRFIMDCVYSYKCSLD